MRRSSSNSLVSSRISSSVIRSSGLSALKRSIKSFQLEDAVLLSLAVIGDQIVEGCHLSAPYVGNLMWSGKFDALFVVRLAMKSLKFFPPLKVPGAAEALSDVDEAIDFLNAAPRRRRNERWVAAVRCCEFAGLGLMGADTARRSVSIWALEGDPTNPRARMRPEPDLATGSPAR